MNDRCHRSGVDGWRRRSEVDSRRRRSEVDSRRRRLVRIGLGLAVGAGFGIAGRAARACDFETSNLRINHVWARASGNASFAIVCMTFAEVAADDRLVGVETPVASGAEIGGLADRPVASARRPMFASPRIELDFSIPAGRNTVLDESGPHLRLTGLRQPLVFGASYPMTLYFQRGDPVLADIDVDYKPLPASAG